MSKIDAQIKALMVKKSKIDYIKYIQDLLVNDKNCIDFSEVKDSVLKDILPFLEKVTEAIESDSTVATEQVEEFSKDQIEALKELADRFTQAKNKPKQQPENKPFKSQSELESRPQVQNQPEMSHNDKMNFAMNNRHLANKRVQVMNDQNVQIIGLVVGLDAPYVQVKTETGPTINVPIEKLSIIK